MKKAKSKAVIAANDALNVRYLNISNPGGEYFAFISSAK
jgi:hypothetical protein